MGAAPIPEPDKGHPVLKFWCVVGWRFFTGAHMDGKFRRHRNGSVLPRYRDYYWNRYSRPKRALIRNICFWVLTGFLYGAKVDWPDTKYAILCVLPFALWRVWVKILNAVTQKTTFTNSDQMTEVYRTLRPKWRRRIARLKLTKIRWRLPDGGPVDPETARAVLAENAVEGGAPITMLRRMEEASAAITDPRSGRSRTIMRNYARKEKRS